MVVECDVNGRAIKVRRLDTIHPCLLRQSREAGREIGPLATVIGRDPYVAIVGSQPQNAGANRGLRNGGYRTVGFRSRVVTRHTTGEASAHYDPRRVSGREVCRDRIEMITTISRLEQPIAAHVNGGRRVGGKKKRRRPVETIATSGIRGCTSANLRERAGDIGRLRTRRVAARDDHGIFEDARSIAAATAHYYRPRVLRDVEARSVSTLRLAVDDVRILRIDGAIEPVPTADVVPVVVSDADAILRARWSAPRSVILETAAHFVRLLHAVAHGVELSDGEGIDKIVGSTAVIGHRNPAVVA